MGNRWHLWDSGAGKPDQLTLVLPGGRGVTQCKMCNAHQEEGLALSFPRPVLTTALGHHSPVCSTSSFKFSSCPRISQDTDTQQLREGWQGCSPEKQQGIGTGTVPPAQQCLDSTCAFEQGHWSQGPGRPRARSCPYPFQPSVTQ